MATLLKLMRPAIRDVLTSADVANLGLIPYLSDKLGGDWDRFQIRPWNFQSADVPVDGKLRQNDNNSGFRLGLQTSQMAKDRRTISVIQALRIGYLLVDSNPLDLQVGAAELALKINLTVAEWSCCTQWANECTLESTGGFVYAPNPNISSGNALAWAIAVVREFELSLEFSTELDNG